MGRAIVRQPKAFLMDEPLSNLDAKLRVQMRAEIAALQRDLGVTTVYVTHDQVEAMTMGDRVAVLKRGTCSRSTAPRTSTNRRTTSSSPAFIGSPSMNLMVATLGGSADAVTVTLGDQTLAVDPVAINARPDLTNYIGREVVVGIRPEDTEDLSVVGDAPPDRVLTSETRLLEALGAEIIVHFPLAAEPFAIMDAEFEGDDAVEAMRSEGEAIYTGRFSPRSTVRVGERLEVVVDTARMHFFDPETGNAIRG